jgi:DNA/RNA-binding domain of Phe-tRNA-synthetase-like protein
VYFHHSDEIWRDFPELAAGGLFVGGIRPDARVEDQTAVFYSRAESRLAQHTIAELPEISAWRRAFSKMGLKPTQYRCASESLLRRFNKERSLPRIHPLIDLCNSISLAFGVPIAVFDVAKITGHLQVRYATGTEEYVTFAGETENPEPDEVIFADESGKAHARRWTNRQSGYSAVREETSEALIVAEAMHESARTDMHELIATLEGELAAARMALPKSAILNADSARFEF